jgi:hypothetical protein
MTIHNLYNPTTQQFPRPAQQPTRGNDKIDPRTNTKQNLTFIHNSRWSPSSLLRGCRSITQHI